MTARVFLRASLAAAALLVWGAGPSLADWKQAAQIFVRTTIASVLEPRPLARQGRGVALKVAPWTRDIIDNGQPWLDIDLMMRAGDVDSYFAGVEVQYEMGKLLTSAPCSGGDDFERCWQSAYESALKIAKQNIASGRKEAISSHWLPIKFESPGDFVAVFEAEATLLSQWFNPLKEFPNFRLSWFDHGMTAVPSDSMGELKSGSLVRFAEGVEKALLALRQSPRCKAIVLFSSKDDASLQYIYERWRVRREDSPVAEPRANGVPLIDAAFSRSHLTLSGDPLHGGVSRIPSKNLRVLDPSLEHVVIVDADPSRIIPEQQYLLRAVPKFDARRFIQAEMQRDVGIPRYSKYYSSLLSQAIAEIIESSERAEKSKAKGPVNLSAEPSTMPFAQAFKPYSFAGRRVLDALKASIPIEEDDQDSKPNLLGHKFRGPPPRMSQERIDKEALEAARTHPELYELGLDSK